MADGFSYNVTAVVKCDCGADMQYDPSLNALKCPYCGVTRTIDKRICFRRDYLSERAQGAVVFDGETYKCPNCAGDVPIKGFDTAVKCPYCGATNVIDIADLKGLKPDSILPFAISKQGAADAGKKWIKKKFFAPYKLKKEFAVDKFYGVYIPSYSFTTETDSSYEGRIGERKTRWVGSGNNRHMETYIDWYYVSGSTDDIFEDVAVEASTQLTQKELNKLLPYDTDNVEAYNKDYLAGFCAERYDTSLEDGFKVAQGQIDKEIRRRILSHYGADEVEYLHVTTEYTDTTFRYTLLPLWVCAYKFRKKAYRFLINGRTGKSTGKTPTSVPKVITTVLLAAAAIVGAVLLWLAYGG